MTTIPTCTSPSPTPPSPPHPPLRQSHWPRLSKMDLEHLLFIASLCPRWCNGRARLSQRRRWEKVLHWEEWKSGRVGERGRGLFPSQRVLLSLCCINKNGEIAEIYDSGTVQRLCSSLSARHSSCRERQNQPVSLCRDLCSDRVTQSDAENVASEAQQWCSSFYKFWSDVMKMTFERNSILAIKVEMFNSLQTVISTIQYQSFCYFPLLLPSNATKYLKLDSL